MYVEKYRQATGVDFMGFGKMRINQPVIMTLWEAGGSRILSGAQKPQKGTETPKCKK